MTLIWLAAALAVYLTFVHAAAFSMDAASARQASLMAVGLLDVAMVALALMRPAALAAPVRGRHRRLALRVLTWLAVAAVIALHVDYLRGRALRGSWMFDTLPALKHALVVAQVALLLLMAAVAAPADRLARVFAIGRRELVSDLALLSLPLVPLVNYFARNRAELTPLAAVEYFAIFLLTPVAVYALLLVLQRLLDARAWAAPLVAGMAFAHYSMPVVAETAKRPVETLLPLQLALVITCAALLVLFATLNRRALTQALAFFVVASSLVSLVAGPASHSTDVARREAVAGSDDGGELEALLAQPAVRRPDIYLLIYDSYSPLALMSHYGIDNSEAASFLEANGFTGYPAAHSLSLATRPTMRSIFDMRTDPQAGVAGANRTLRFLTAQGYRTHVIFSAYLAAGSEPVAADVVFPKARYRMGADALYRGVAGGEFKAEIVLEDSPRDEWLAAKRAALAETPDVPKFVYGHSRLPGHSQNSGQCLPDETERYAARLEQANHEMRADIETILATGRPSIVIVAGDHGAYLTADCFMLVGRAPESLTAVELADRHGALLAIRWPDGAAAPGRDRILTVQDIMFGVAAFMLDDERVYEHRLPASTFGYGGIPHGAVQNGIVTVGRDSGRSIAQ